MFPGNAEAGFNYFCQWAYDVSQRGPGKKVLLVEELWRYSTSHKISTELATVAQMGRAEELELVINTQLPHKINGSIIGQATEAVCFRLQSDLALDCVRTELEIAPAAVRDLPLGTFIARNRLSGATEQAALW